jgi:hypothetical protein
MEVRQTFVVKLIHEVVITEQKKVQLYRHVVPLRNETT